MPIRTGTNQVAILVEGDHLALTAGYAHAETEHSLVQRYNAYGRHNAEAPPHAVRWIRLGGFEAGLSQLSVGPSLG